MSGSHIGVVVIGRNEGDRLRRCLESVCPNNDFVVYVDSGSTDGSVHLARQLGCDVIELDIALPFTAARARNEGFYRILELKPIPDYVQFVDGDCEVVKGWIPAAASFLDANQKVAAVCGRRRERYPESSVYNKLCDIEWSTPVGESKLCGGDVMVRVSAFASVGGFRASLIAGEEPELCVRLRAAQWKIWRLDAEMTLHDAAMTRFSQWWRRSLRNGHASAEVTFLHGTSPERYRIKEFVGIWIWGMGIPVTASICMILIGPIGLLALGLYGMQIVRIAIRKKPSARENWFYAIFTVVGKFPELLGQIKFFISRWLRQKSQLIEYK